MFETNQPHIECYSFIAQQNTCNVYQYIIFVARNLQQVCKCWKYHDICWQLGYLFSSLIYFYFRHYLSLLHQLPLQSSISHLSYTLSPEERCFLTITCIGCLTTARMWLIFRCLLNVKKQTIYQHDLTLIPAWIKNDTIINVGWNYLSIPKLQRCECESMLLKWANGRSRVV